MISASDMKGLNKIIIKPSRKHQHLDPATPNKSDMMRAKIDKYSGYQIIIVLVLAVTLVFLLQN